MERNMFLLLTEEISKLSREGHNVIIQNITRFDFTSLKWVKRKKQILKF